MASIALAYIMPLLSFFFVFTLVFALLAKTRVLGGNAFIHFTISAVIAIVFVLSPLATKFTALTVPWIAIFIAIVFFILLILTFIRGSIDDLVSNPVIAIIVVAVILVIFLLAAINVLGPLMSHGALSTETVGTINFFTDPKFLGLVALVIIAAVVSWVVTK